MLRPSHPGSLSLVCTSVMTLELSGGPVWAPLWACLLFPAVQCWGPALVCCGCRVLPALCSPQLSPSPGRLITMYTLMACVLRRLHTRLPLTHHLHLDVSEALQPDTSKAKCIMSSLNSGSQVLHRLILQPHPRSATLTARAFHGRHFASWVQALPFGYFCQEGPFTLLLPCSAAPSSPSSDVTSCRRPFLNPLGGLNAPLCASPSYVLLLRGGGELTDVSARGSASSTAP